MSLHDRINNLKDDDLFTLLSVLTCPEGQEFEIYEKNLAAKRLREGINARQAESSQNTAAANK